MIEVQASYSSTRQVFNHNEVLAPGPGLPEIARAILRVQAQIRSSVPDTAELSESS